MHRYLCIYVHICQNIKYKYIVLCVKLAAVYAINVVKVPSWHSLIIFFHPIPSPAITTGHDCCTFHTHAIIIMEDAKGFCFCALHPFLLPKKKNYFTYLAVSRLSLGTRDLVPWSGIEPRPPALGKRSLSQWTTSKWKKVKVAQSCLTLCNPMDLYNPWNSSGQNTGVGGLSLFQGVFPT